MIIDNGKIRFVFMQNGFKSKQQENNTIDLNPYVFDAAYALEAEILKPIQEAIGVILKEDENDSPKYGTPNHCHKVRGLWDQDGSKCFQCEAWDFLRGILPKPIEKPVSPMKEMGKERYNLLQSGFADLTKKEIESGWYFDDEYDGLLVHKSWEGHERE